MLDLNEINEALSASKESVSEGYSLILEDYDKGQKINAVKELRGNCMEQNLLTGWYLKDYKIAVENCPTTLAENLSSVDAHQILEKFKSKSPHCFFALKKEKKYA